MYFTKNLYAIESQMDNSILRRRNTRDLTLDISAINKDTVERKRMQYSSSVESFFNQFDEYIKDTVASFCTLCTPSRYH